MNDFVPIIGGLGLQDGLNPCIWMACAVMAAHGLWGRARLATAAWGLRAVFIAAYGTGFFIFNFSGAQVLIFHKIILGAVRVIYFVLGASALGAGAWSFKKWGSLRLSGKTEGNIPQAPGRPVDVLTAYLLAVVLGLMLGAMSCAGWSISDYMMALGNGIILKAQWGALPLLMVYVLASLWPLWMVWGVLSIKNLSPAFVNIFSAAVFWTAASCMMLVFFK